MPNFRINQINEIIIDEKYSSDDKINIITGIIADAGPNFTLNDFPLTESKHRGKLPLLFTRLSPLQAAAVRGESAIVAFLLQQRGINPNMVALPLQLFFRKDQPKSVNHVAHDIALKFGIRLTNKGYSTFYLTLFCYAKKLVGEFRSLEGVLLWSLIAKRSINEKLTGMEAFRVGCLGSVSVTNIQKFCALSQSIVPANAKAEQYLCVAQSLLECPRLMLTVGQCRLVSHLFPHTDPMHAMVMDHLKQYGFKSLEQYIATGTLLEPYKKRTKLISFLSDTSVLGNVLSRPLLETIVDYTAEFEEPSKRTLRL